MGFCSRILISLTILLCCTTMVIDGGVYRQSFAMEDLSCEELPKTVLEYLLGSAFNPRYMSIDTPFEDSDDLNIKRKVGSTGEDFYVDDNFYDIIDDKPAWEVENHVAISRAASPSPETTVDVNRKRKRDTDYLQQWDCKSKVVWSDLGPDYFPRYMRSVECLAKNCWFNMYLCKPKAFTVKLLRRKKGKCVKAEKGRTIGVVGLHKDLKELWVWEERAVTFCCDCARAF